MLEMTEVLIKDDTENDSIDSRNVWVRRRSGF